MGGAGILLYRASMKESLDTGNRKPRNDLVSSSPQSLPTFFGSRQARHIFRLKITFFGVIEDFTVFSVDCDPREPFPAPHMKQNNTQS
jgi:hypothetical protein